jgi:type I restriction enzyme M protein
MTILEILNTKATDITLSDLFSPAASAAINAALSENASGKPVIHCRARNKDVPAKREEIIRQLWLYRLEKRYHYPLSRIAVEYPITFGRDTSKRADIVVLDADRADVPLLIVEVKAQKQKDGKEQLKSYTHATGAPLALWSNGVSEIIWHRKNPNYFVEISDLPSASQTIEDIVSQPWTVQTLIEKEKQRETEGIKARSLRQIIEDLEDEVLANAGVDVFEEVFKLIFTKLYDELACHRRWKNAKHLRFRNQNTATQLKTAIQNLFDEAREKWRDQRPPHQLPRLEKMGRHHHRTRMAGNLFQRLGNAARTTSQQKRLPQLPVRHPPRQSPLRRRNQANRHARPLRPSTFLAHGKHENASTA